jgi:hypothetical protein
VASVAGAERKRGRGRRGRVRVDGGEGGEGGPGVTVGSAWRSTTASNHRARAAPLPRGPSGTWLTSETGARRGPVEAAGVLERAGKRGRAATGHQQADSGNTMPGRWFKQYFEQILNSNVSNKFQTV